MQETKKAGKIIVSYFFFLIILLWCGMMQGAPKKTSKKVDPEEVLRKGKEAFYNYDFNEAEELFEEYRSLMEKQKQEVDEEFEELEGALVIAGNAFERVQQIVILDSISIPANKFMETYKLSESSGRIGLLEDILEEAGLKVGHASFINEPEDYIITSIEDEDGDLILMESRKMLDGKWENLPTLKGDFERSGDYAYPFLSGDGQTLYFANNGEGSMGGYDLFIAQKDPISGEYLQPLNLGMPFNSPYDDFMLAIDEERGIGWWATDRGREDGNVTVYVYKVDEIRKNYPSDTENLASYARIDRYKDTWKENDEIKYASLLAGVMTPETRKMEKKEDDFTFPLGDGRIYNHYSDFRNRKASDMMKLFAVKGRELQQKEGELSRLRKEYKKGNNPGKIIETEESVEKLRGELESLRKEILKLEKSMR